MQPLLNALKSLVVSFADNEGLPSLAFDATLAIIESLLGSEAVEVFSGHVKATEDRWYLKENADPFQIWHQMIAVTPALGKTF